MIMFRILEKYGILSTTDSVEKYGSGPFNRTYVAFTKTDNNYILQLYENYFKSRSDDYTPNSQVIINEIKDKMNIDIVLSDEGNNYAVVDHYFIRCYKVNKEYSLFNRVYNNDMAKSIGKGLGLFYQRTNNISLDKILFTDSDFHNVEKRIVELDLLASKDLAMYLALFNMIKYLFDRKDKANLMFNLLNDGTVPTRIIHNNIRKTNFIFTYSTYELVEMIGLSATTKGSLLHDYGNAIRYLCSTASESEKNLFNVKFDMNLIEEFTRAFLTEVKDIITEEECKYLVDSIRVQALDNATKYLTDHINGNELYSIEYKTQNIDRCKNQIKLIEEFEEKYEEINKLIQEVVDEIINK